MEEASLENVASEKVSLSKIASGPCIRHRSFHRAFIEVSKSIHLDVSLLQCSAVLFSSVTFGILKETSDRCQHIATFRPFKVSGTFSAD